MKNELQVIDERIVLGKNIKVYGTFDDPLFIAQDVAEWIEHTDVSTMVRTVDSSEKLVQTVLVSAQRRQMLFLTEDGMYEVLMQSRKPIAKEFKKQVKIILKSIRKTGSYSIENLSPAEAFLKQAQMMVDFERRQKEIEVQFDTVKDRIHLVESKLKDDPGYFSITGYANLIGISVTDEEAKSFGKKATKISKELGMDTTRVRHPRWGFVGGYHESVLSLVMQQSREF